MNRLLQRYISSELTHFIGRGLSLEDQYSILKTILDSGFLTHSPHDPLISGNLIVNPSAKLSQDEMYSPQVVCFCDIPVQDLQIHISKYSPIGIAFAKTFVASNGASPVFYIPKSIPARTPWEFPTEFLDEIFSPGIPVDDFDSFTKAKYFDWMVTVYDKLFQSLIKQTGSLSEELDVSIREVQELQRFFDFHVFSFVKFFDHELSDVDSDNYYFEREWRMIGNLKFSLDDVTRIIIPREFSRRLRSDQPNYVGQVTFVD